MPAKTRKFSSRILLVVLLAYALSSFYYVYSLYTSKLEASEKGTLERLESISNTLASQLDGTTLKMLLELYEGKDEIRDKYGNPYYRQFVETLQRTASLNKLPTDIYTLTYDSLNDEFFFGPSSAELQYYRHIYKNPPSRLKEKYHDGAKIPMYHDEHGTWLSAFSPLKDSKGQTIAVVQADMPFDKFIMEARSEMLQNILLNLALIIVVAILLFYWLRSLLQREEGIMRQLSVNNEIIQKKNEDITSSIAYAKRIQQSLMDTEHKLKSIFPSSFVLYKPKDIVSGDFYWIQSMNEENTKVAVAAADCTGHGVPGALVSVLGITHLREMVSRQEDVEPNKILEELNQRIISTFKTQDKGMTSKDGMDISVCVIDKKNKTLQYAGAYRPLLIIRDGELTEIAGDKQPIGGDHFVENRSFTNHNLDYKEGDWIYMFSDGYVDQFGGEKSRKFMKKRFKNLLKEICTKDCQTQNSTLKEELKDWMGTTDQVDDITVLGLQLN